MEQISNRKLISQLYNAANQQLEATDFDSGNWSEWYQAVQSMDAPTKMVYLMVKMNQKITNGGFAEFYEAGLGIFAPEIIYVLTEIKASASASIMSSSLAVVNPNGLLDEAYKAFVFKINMTEEQKKALFSQDLLYDDLQDRENLEDLLGGYLQGA